MKEDYLFSMIRLKLDTPKDQGKNDVICRDANCTSFVGGNKQDTTSINEFSGHKVEKCFKATKILENKYVNYSLK